MNAPQHRGLAQVVGRATAPEALRVAVLGGGIAALALMAAVDIVATLVITVTTLLHVPWSDAWFRGLAGSMLAAVLLAHGRDYGRDRAPGAAAFAFGVVVGTLPALFIAASHVTEHWDDFMTWLPNARYLWAFGELPSAEAAPVGSALPGYPPGSSLLLAAIWSVPGRVVEAAGPVLNVACLMILPGLVLRTMGAAVPQRLPTAFALGAMLAVATTILNVGLDWHWVLSCLPEAAMLVAFAAAFRLGAEPLVLGQKVSRWHYAALAAILGLIANLKQTGMVLVALLLAALLVGAWMFGNSDRTSRRGAARALLLAAIPSLLVWGIWQVYLERAFAAHAVSFRPWDAWHLSLLPDLLLAIARSMAEHWLFFIPIVLVTVRGWYVIGCHGLARNGTDTSPADRLAAVFALIETGYCGFLLACYLGAFHADEVVRAAEWFRYQAEIGGAGLLTAIALAADRYRAVPVVPALVAVSLATAIAVLQGPGVFWSKPYLSPSKIDRLRQVGRTAGLAIARGNGPVTVDLVSRDELLAVLIVRYEVWANAPLRVRKMIFSPASDEGDDLLDLVADGVRHGFQTVALGSGPAYCAVRAHPTGVQLLGAASRECQSVMARVAQRLGARR